MVLFPLPNQKAESSISSSAKKPSAAARNYIVIRRYDEKR
jgi:hypothetical protein